MQKSRIVSEWLPLPIDAAGQAVSELNSDVDTVLDFWLNLVEAPFEIAWRHDANLAGLIKRILFSQNLASIFGIESDDDSVSIDMDYVHIDVDLTDNTISIWVYSLEDMSLLLDLPCHNEHVHRLKCSVWDLDEHIINNLAVKRWIDAGPGELLHVIGLIRRIQKSVIDRAVASGRWHVRARRGSPLETRMRHIPKDAWKFLEITDWKNGVAVDPTGEQIFSAHIVPTSGGLSSVSLRRLLASGFKIGGIDFNSSDFVGPIIEPLLNPAPHGQQRLKPALHSVKANASDGAASDKVKSSIRLETLCRKWLAGMMQESPDLPEPKWRIWDQANRDFPGLSRAAFERAWKSAVEETGAFAWSRSGRRQPANRIESPD